jgi:NAD+--asparagine ADP-ribosyltransferase
MTMSEYNNEIQLYRDQIDYAFKSYESDAERMAALARTEMQMKGQIDAAKEASKGAAYAQLGNYFSKTDVGQKLPGMIIDGIGEYGGDAWDTIGDWVVDWWGP